MSELFCRLSSLSSVVLSFSLSRFSLSFFSLIPLSLSLFLSLFTHQLDHADVGPPGLAVHGHRGHALDPILDGVGDVGDDLEKVLAKEKQKEVEFLLLLPCRSS